MRARKREQGTSPPWPSPSPGSQVTCSPLLHPLQAAASPVAAFAANDVDKVHMGEHRVAVHRIRQRVRFSPFERPGGEGRA